MADRNDQERPKTQAESDYNEHYSSAKNYYGDDSNTGTERPERKYDQQTPTGGDSPSEADASYDRHRYSNDELSKLSGAHGNDEWFASGAGVSNEPFERTWSGSTTPQRPSAGMIRVSDRRTITRRDIGHDPFIVRVGAEERRVSSQDRRSGIDGRSMRRHDQAPPRTR